MRTSRIARETARVMHALSPSKRRTRSLRAFANDTSPPKNKSDIELSTPPSDPEHSRSTTSLGKRKRGSTEKHALLTNSDSVESTEPRRSPRKAAKPEEPPKRKPRRQPAKHIKSEDGRVTVEPPAKWEEVYSITREMRKRVLAPVDTMGCESLAEENRSPLDKRLQTLVALMLSSQTKDTVTAVAMKNLQDSLPGGFNLDALLQIEPESLNEMIQKVGFHNNKTKFIKSVALILKDKFNGDIPDTIEGLVSLPGVGPKMAYLCMSAAWGRDEGIGVDVHVHRITNLWGWHKTSTPEQTRAELEAWLPKEKWHDINNLLVGFGQTICLPVGRKCDDCDLSTRKLCPSAVAGSAKKKKVEREVGVKFENGEMVRNETVVEADDAAAAVHIKSEEIGDVDAQIDVADIEGLGAGSLRRLAESAHGGI